MARDNGMPSVNSAMVIKTGAASETWARFFSFVSKSLTGKEPLRLKSCSVTSLPDPALYPEHLIYVADEAGGAVPAFSDGIHWRRVTDRAIVS